MGRLCLRALLPMLALLPLAGAYAQSPPAAVSTVSALPSPPVAERRPVRLVQHGIERVDDYAWLKDPNWREVIRDSYRLAPEIRAYIDAENAYAEAVLAPLAGLRAKLLAEIKGRVEQFDSGVPMPEGPYAYWSKFVPGAEHIQVVRAPRDGGAEQVLLDGPWMAQGKPYFSLSSYDQSPDHKLMAYMVDESGSEAYFLGIRDLTTGYDSPYVIPNVSDFAWAADSHALFYVRRDAEQRPRLVYRHKIGSDPSTDVLIFEEHDPAFNVSVNRSRTQRFVTLATSNLDTSEVWLIDAAKPESAPVLLTPRESGVRYNVDDWGDDFVIRTNAGGAADFKLVLAPAAHPGRENWRDLVPYRQGVQIEAAIPLANHLVRLENENGQQRIVIRRKSDGAEHTVGFSEEAYSLALTSPFEFDTATLRFSYGSPTTPTQIFDYDLNTRERTLRKQQVIPSGHDPSAYVVRRLFAPAADGELIPVTLLYKKGLALDGSAPAFLTGYGAYGSSLSSDFNENAFSLVDRGVIYIKAHVRGGLEKGDRWREAGRRQFKMNSFTDFIAVAEYLTREKYTSAGRIVAYGGSAGGLLVGAVANMRPDLFAGIVAQVPFVDAINTMLDSSLPLTDSDTSEWGDPVTDVEAYRTIAAYSPYDNVKAQAYPRMLVTAGLSDPRVTYWEPAKWVAKLRAMKTDNNRIVLVTNMAAGHSGAPGRFQGLDEVAMIYAFALDTVGKREP